MPLGPLLRKLSLASPEPAAQLPIHATRQDVPLDAVVEGGTDDWALDAELERLSRQPKTGSAPLSLASVSEAAPAPTSTGAPKAASQPCAASAPSPAPVPAWMTRPVPAPAPAAEPGYFMLGRGGAKSPGSTTPSTPASCSSGVISLFDQAWTEAFPFLTRLALGEGSVPLQLPAPEEVWPGDVPAPVAAAVAQLVQSDCSTAVARRLLAADDATGRQAVDYLLGQVLLARATRPVQTPQARRRQRQRRGALAGWLQRLLAAGADIGRPCACHRGAVLTAEALARRLRDAEAMRLLDRVAHQRRQAGLS